MGTYRALIVCLLLLGVASAQQSPNNQFKVEGVIVNTITGKPLPRVLVQINGRSLLTGAEGDFSFDGVPAGGVFIGLTKPGYFPPGAGPFGGAMGRNINVGPDTGKLALKLAPEGVITGHVSGQDGDPLEGATVQVLAFMSMEGRQQLAPVGGGGRTDEDGNFRVAGLRSGRYYLAIKAGNLARRVLGAQTPKAPEAYPAILYYPGTTDLAGATPVELSPGQRVEASFAFALGPAYKLAGTIVTTGEWKQVGSPLIIDATAQPLLTPDQFDALSGAFEFRAVPAGTYTIRVGGSDQENRYTFLDRKITVSKSVTDLKLSLRPGVNIPVEVRTEFSKPAQQRTCLISNGPGGQQSDCSDYPAASVELISMDSANVRFSTDFRSMKDSSPYAVHAVPPGKYMVRTRPAFSGYVQSVRSGDLDLLREVLTVPDEGTVAPIEIVVRDDSSTLHVTLRAQKRGQNATILVSPDGAPFSIPRMTGTNLVTASLSQIAPGNYKVFAFDSIEGVDYMNPDVLAKYAAQAASVTVTPNGNASVIVDVIHVGE